MDSEEEIMSENDECLFEKSSCESFTSLVRAGEGQTVTHPYEQPQQYLSQQANLVWEDPTSSETSWTDEKHSLYLSYIEDAFVTSLYEQGYYRYPCKRWQVERGTVPFLYAKNLNEEVESGPSYDYEPYAFHEESQCESEMPGTPNHVESRLKDCSFKAICCSNESSYKQDVNGKRDKRKFEHEPAKPTEETRQKFKEEEPEVQAAKHNHEHKSSVDEGQDRPAQNREEGSERLLKVSSSDQEDQVVPSMGDTSPRDVRL